MKKRFLLSTVIAAVLFACAFCISTSPVSAASGYSNIAGGTIKIENGASAQIPFNVTSKKYVMAVAWPTPLVDEDDDDVLKYLLDGDMEIRISNTGGKSVAKKIADVENDELVTGDYCYFCLTKNKIKGQHYFTLKNMTGKRINVKYSVRAFNKPASSASLKKKKSFERDEWAKIGNIKGGTPVVKSIKSSSKKITNKYIIDYNGDVYVYGNSAGTCTITTTLKSGKKYKTKVTVKPLMPDVLAYLNYYDTRDNYFEVRIKNNGDKTITVIRKGGKVENVNYKSFDRDFKNSSDVKIKPGKTKNVRFYCKGTPTWYNHKDYTLFAKIKSEGKTWIWHVWDEQSVFRKGKKWVNSYWDEEDYENW